MRVWDAKEIGSSAGGFLPNEEGSGGEGSDVGMLITRYKFFAKCLDRGRMVTAIRQNCIIFYAYQRKSDDPVAFRL